MSKSILLASILAGLISAYSYGLDNPDSLYSAGLAGANPHKDPWGQMKNFLGITWNFLPENTRIQQEVKTSYARIYKTKYGQDPVDIEYSIPASANMKKVCTRTIEKCQRYGNKLMAENSALKDTFNEQKAKFVAVEAELSTLKRHCSENEAEYEKAQKTLQEEREQCKKDIDAIQQGYGTLVAYRNAFREKEKDLTEKMNTFISIRYGTCALTEELKICQSEREESLQKVVKDLERLVPLIKESATSLRKAVNETIGIDFEIPIQVRVGTITYTLTAIMREIQGHVESNRPE